MNPIEDSSSTPRRLAVGVVLPVIGAAVAAVALTTTSLPDPVASHWGGGGEPDDSIGLGIFTGLFGVLIVASGTACWWASRRRDVNRGDLTAPVAFTTLMQWIFVGVVVVIAWANDGADEWTDAADVPLPLALLIPVAAALIGAGAGTVVRGIGVERPVEPERRPTVGRAPGERLVWVRRMTTRWPLIMGGAIAIVGAPLVVLVDSTIGVIILVAAAVVALFAWLHVTADQRGLIVCYGPFRWPRTRIDLDRIEKASVVHVAPRSHGGWGYRGSVRLFGRAAVVVRAGEGLQLDLRDGKRFTVTVDDAETGAGTLNDLIAG